MSQHQPSTKPNPNGYWEVEVPDPEVVARAAAGSVGRLTSDKIKDRVNKCYDNKHHRASQGKSGTKA